MVEHSIELEDFPMRVSKDISLTDRTDDWTEQSLEINKSDCNASFNIDVSKDILENGTKESFRLDNSDYRTSWNDSKYCRIKTDSKNDFNNNILLKQLNHLRRMKTILRKMKNYPVILQTSQLIMCNRNTVRRKA